jgi:hypothetical protein
LVNQRLIRLRRTDFYTQYSNIPPFHWTSKNKLHPFGLKSKAGPIGPDSLLPVAYSFDSGLKEVVGEIRDSTKT